MAQASEAVHWEPNPGPQTALLTCPVEDALYGGARGGGKTDGLLGDWISHADEWGEHARGILFRRTYPELEQIQERAEELYAPMAPDGWHGTSRTWTFPNGARLKMRHLERDKDASKYQGHSYCVAVGTPVVMADGSMRAIEDVRVGDYVRTLEGPRRVNATLTPYQAPCVEAEVYDRRGVRVGSQVHPKSHPILTNAGVRRGPSGDSPRTASRSLDEVPALPTPTAKSRPENGRGIPAWFSWSGGDRSGCREWSDSPQGVPQPHRLSAPAVLHAQTIRSARRRRGVGSGEPSLYRFQHKSFALSSDSCRERTWGRLGRWRHLAPSQSTPPSANRCAASDQTCGPRESRRGAGSPGGYPTGSGLGDGPAPFWRETDRGRIPLRGGAVAPCPTGGEKDAPGTTPTRSRPVRRTWEHPYSGEERCLSEDYEVGRVVLKPCGLRWVTDLNVSDANHYITSTGLVNKNTWIAFDELTHWPSKDPIDKLRATLRSAHGVHCVIRATANPGGPGHNWVKSRYIDPAPPFTPHEDERGTLRVFIPARLEDNPALQENDPDYWQRVEAAASGNEALLKAWRHGDWDIVAGGMFDDLWDRSKHVLPVFDVPSDWRIVRTFDWGSRKPFSVGWWACANGSVATLPDGATFQPPKGSMIRIAEWYGWNGREPNKGIRMTDSEIGRGIVKREKDMDIRERVKPGPADPSIFSTKPGETTPADALEAVGAGFIPADAGPGSVQRGCETIRRMLMAAAQDRPEDPGLWVTESCRQFIRTVPVLPRDSKKPEQYDTDAEDHIADETRYALTMKVKETVGANLPSPWG